MPVLHPLHAANILDLSESLVLLVHSRGMAIGDRRPPHECGDAPYWVMAGEDDSPPVAVYLIIDAETEGANGWEVPISVAPEPVHEAYGNRVLMLRAQFASGVAEDWTLRSDPVQVSFDWIRQPHVIGGHCSFHIHTPVADSLQFWRTVEGAQTAPLSSRVHPDGGKPDSLLWEGNASGALLYSVAPRASVYLDAGASGLLHIHIRNDSSNETPSWGLNWTVPHGQMARLSGFLGMRASTAHFCERSMHVLSDASIDFGAYYDQALLGGIALLARQDGSLRGACLADGGISAELPPDELVLACESLSTCAPELVADLLRAALEACAETRSLPVPGANLQLPIESGAGLLLIMAARLVRLTGETTILERHHTLLRGAAESLLALRRPGEALPVFTFTESGVTLRAKHPAGTALAYAGLSRWAVLEERMGHAEEGLHFAEAAFAMQWAAVAPVEAGGLWHLGRGTFVRCLPSPGTARHPDADLQSAPGSEFDFGQQVIAFWLGLCPDDELVRRSYEWLDYTYTYASGRGGPAYPPGYRRSFHALLDVAVRQRYRCGEVASLLQRAVDLGGRGGIPFSRNLFGDGLPAGTLLDNAPYFEIVLQRHYGLDYDAGGWRLTNPRPIANYPLTRVTNLRHKNALFAITWQGRGTIQRLTLNGAPHPSRVLDKVTGEHEVVITLG